MFMLMLTFQALAPRLHLMIYLDTLFITSLCLFAPEVTSLSNFSPPSTSTLLQHQVHGFFSSFLSFLNRLEVVSCPSAPLTCSHDALLHFYSCVVTLKDSHVTQTSLSSCLFILSYNHRKLIQRVCARVCVCV